MAKRGPTEPKRIEKGRPEQRARGHKQEEEEKIQIRLQTIGVRKAYNSNLSKIVPWKDI